MRKHLWSVYWLLLLSITWVSMNCSSPPTLTQTPPSIAAQPASAADRSGALHVVFVGPTSSIVYTRSQDGGYTWSPPATLSRQPGIASHPQVAIEGNSLKVSWHQQDSASMLSRDDYVQSEDGGRTWGQLQTQPLRAFKFH